MKHFASLLALVAFSAATLHAQSSSGVPESHRPPPGMCRIWIDGVPPTHQPAPTDCATAIRKRPLNARVVFGSDAPGSERNFTPAPPKQSSFSQPNTPSRDDQDRAAQQQQQQQQQHQQQQQAQQIREEQERQRAEAQRQREEQEKRAASSHAPPSPPPRTEERATPPPRVHTDKPQRPPHSSFSARRPG